VIGFPAALAAKSIGIPTIEALGLGDPVETRLINSLLIPVATSPEFPMWQRR